MTSVLITGASRGYRAGYCACGSTPPGLRSDRGRPLEEAGRSLGAEASPRLRGLSIDVGDQGRRAAAADSVGGTASTCSSTTPASPSAASVEALPLAELRRQLEVYVVGQVAVTQAMLPALRAARGRIVFDLVGAPAAPRSRPHAVRGVEVRHRGDRRRPPGRAARVGHRRRAGRQPGSIDTETSRRSGQAQLHSTVAAMSDEHRRLDSPLLEGTRKLVAQTAEARGAGRQGRRRRHRGSRRTKERPRRRYVAGADAKLQIALRTLLPARAFDALLARMMGVR